MLRILQHRTHDVQTLPPGGFALVMSIHDELVFAVATDLAETFANEAARIMEGVGVECGLRVPLAVAVRRGTSLADLSGESDRCCV
jgi:DNA polymerase I-like protein with 3'-5' exonuclease and polymerase domains